MPTGYVAQAARATIIGVTIGVELSEPLPLPHERTEPNAVAAPHEVPGARLGGCPRCAYDLRTLPIQHRCPECGLEVDRRWEVFGGPMTAASSRRFGNALKGFVLVWTVIPAAILAGFTFTVMPAGHYLPLHAGMVILVASMIWLVRRKPRQWVAVGPDGVVIYRSASAIERHSWSEVKKARNDTLRKSIAIELASGEIRVRHYKFCGFAINEADRCAAAINRHAKSTA